MQRERRVKKKKKAEKCPRGKDYRNDANSSVMSLQLERDDDEGMRK